MAARIADLYGMLCYDRLLLQCSMAQLRWSNYYYLVLICWQRVHERRFLSKSVKSSVISVYVGSSQVSSLG